VPLSPNCSNCYCSSHRDAHFELLSIVIPYFIAEMWWKTFKLETPTRDAKMGVLGDNSAVGDAMVMNPHRHILGWICVIWAIMSLSTTSHSSCARACEPRNKKGTETSCFTYMPGRHRTADCNQNWHIPRSCDLVNRSEFRVDQFNRFGSTRGRIAGSPIGMANGPNHIGMRYRVAMWFSHIWVWFC
jgi:hypothetical protein